MDRRGEEETEYGERRRNQPTEEESLIGKTFELIPLDLIHDILLRLPAKSAVRFRAVSKLWSSITTRPDFIRSFAFQSSSRLCLLVCVKAGDKRLFISLPQHELSVDSAYCSYVDRCQIKYPEGAYRHYHDPGSGSVHGLVSFGDFHEIVVWNPSMRQHVTLPDPPKPIVKYYIRSCLGHDPVEDKYKVLCISGTHRGYHDPFVFTLGPQESWRVAQNSPSYTHIPLPTMGRLGICINGHVYYEAEIRFKGDGDTIIFENVLMSFDVRYEEFNTIKKPPDDHGLGDGDKQEWSLNHFVWPFPSYPQNDPIFKCQLLMRGVTHDTGEFIFTATTFEAFAVLYYDPKRKRARRIVYEGIGDEEFWIHNGILEGIRHNIDWFPNHCESLMSLGNVLIKAD
ncbi:putative F-box protein At4g21240 isoform X1 [Capsella rubella]|uniref:putative F-box protein At4g21240 isoform X1 n=1 Tax=Capsella rubella TaxID=81985 RepID=UPI000CD4AB54|nr:putative F-box protein At4g21240 isoform X1 [Capsella rubella]